MEQNNSTETDNLSHVAGSPDEGSTLNTTKPTQDPIKNLKGEFTRKFSKLDEKINQVLTAMQSRNTVEAPAEEADVDTDVKQYVNSVMTQTHQKTALQEAYEMFPELNPESDNYDEKFYKAVDAEFSTNMRKDPKGPLKAAKLIAMELGKIEQLTQNKLLKDEARRSRILQEGSSTPRDAKKASEAVKPEYAKNLSRLGINLDKLNKRIKDNKDKYE